MTWSFSKFPLWSEVDSNLEQSLEFSTMANTMLDISYGESFLSFANRQNMNLKNQLLEIVERIKLLSEKSKANTSILANVRSELSRLIPLNEIVNVDRKKTKELISATEKSKREYNKAQFELESLVMKKGESNPSYPKCIAKRDQTKAVAESSEADMLKRNDEQKKIDLAYKREFYETLLRSLSVFASTRKSNFDGLSLIGEEIAEISERIEVIDDPHIEAFRKELTELDEIII